MHAGLDQADDRDVWEYAKVHGLVIVSKDADFRELSFLLGAPPKVVWLGIGNCTTGDVEHLLRANAAAIREFEGDSETAFLELVL